ncbi:MAG: proton-conducting transporter membrane subunit, partial [Candidatus Aminicenantaceae bacterium]
MNSFLALLPLLIIVFASLLVLILEVFVKKENKNYLAYISLLSLAVCGFICVMFWNKAYSYFSGNLLLDNLSLFLTFLLALATGFVFLLSMKYISLQDTNYGEFYALLLLAFSGVIIMVSSSDILVIFLGLEVLSISSYALAALRRKDEKSSEAAIKYFLLGSFATAFLIYG